MPVRTYLDSSVLIAIVEGERDVAETAFQHVDDQTRAIVLSEAVRLEVMPLRLRDHRKRRQLEQLQRIFQEAATMVGDFPERVWERAVKEAADYAMQPMDALHVAAAVEAEAEELLTAERPEKGLCKTKSLQVISLRACKQRNLH